MILCDTGPLVAIFDKGDTQHEKCVAALATLPRAPLLTTWPCLTECMYLLDKIGGLPAQEELWSLLLKGTLVLHSPATNEWRRMIELMREYSDAPMDFADASLVSAAEQTGLRRIFTIDSHFYAYRINGKEQFEVVP
jgi:uncharacterized protein